MPNNCVQYKRTFTDKQIKEIEKNWDEDKRQYYFYKGKTYVEVLNIWKLHIVMSC